MPTDLKLGALIWNQYTDWPALQRAGQRADELGYDSLWTWDHLYPIVGDWRGPMFEGYLTLAGWVPVTKRATLGLMVGANTFRNPALTAKMVTTLDHMSGGRAVLGIGAAWFETEHTAFGIEFGSGFGERLDWLDEAVEIMHGMLRGRTPSGRDRYRTREVRNDPPPLQEQLPILIGGSGEKKTLRTVARFADAWNVGGSPEKVRHKDEVLRRWCDEVGRDESEIERTLMGGAVILRGTVEEAKRARAAYERLYDGWDDPATTPQLLAEELAPYLELGFRHIYIDFPAPFDEETMERVVTDVKPLLEERAASAVS